MPAAFVRAVSKTFGKRRALDGRLARAFARGEMVGLIGPSGSGKSTLLRAITRPGRRSIAARARIEAFGVPVQKSGRVSDQVRQARASLGFIFQQFNLVGRLSLFTNAMLGAAGAARPLLARRVRAVARAKRS